MWFIINYKLIKFLGVGDIKWLYSFLYDVWIKKNKINMWVFLIAVAVFVFFLNLVCCVLLLNEGLNTCNIID